MADRIPGPNSYQGGRRPQPNAYQGERRPQPTPYREDRRPQPNAYQEDRRPQPKPVTGANGVMALLRQLRTKMTTQLRNDEELRMRFFKLVFELGFGQEVSERLLAQIKDAISPKTQQEGAMDLDSGHYVQDIEVTLDGGAMDHM
jgi:hypothetical protein